MKILLYGINFYPELTGTGKYTGEMFEWLCANNHDVKVITAPPYYPEWKIHSGYSVFRYKTEKISHGIVIRCPLYVPTKLTTLKRILHLTSFAINSFFPLIAQSRWKPDLIITIVPTLFCVPGMHLLAKLTKAKTLIHVQDYEIDAMIGLDMVKKGIFSHFSILFEKWCLRSVDLVSTISKRMMERASEKGVQRSKIIFFPNWAETTRFDSIGLNDLTRMYEDLGIDCNRKIILYSGNISKKQGLEVVIEAAEKLQDENYLFLIVGQGGGKDELEDYASSLNLKNVIFRPLQAYERLPALLKIADCHLVIQKRGAADAVLPSKLTNILAVGGNAVITADENTELGCLCIEYPGIAVLAEPESSESLILAIREVLCLPKQNNVAKDYAKNFLEKEKILSTFMDKVKASI
jgi:colanic acid biosynthesis glycosyl transferase WcaI